MASIYVEAQSSSSILAYLYNLSSTGESGRTVEWYLDGDYVGYDSLGTSDSTTNNFTFDSLDAGTTYTITGKILLDGYVVESKSTTCTTLSGSGSDLTEWEIFDTHSALNMEDQYEVSYVINEYQVNRIKMSFVGTYTHALDAKNRIFIPSTSSTLYGLKRRTELDLI